jgi:hypothetical protein
MMRIVNTSSTGVPYSELKIRYWYTTDAALSPISFQCYEEAGDPSCTLVTGAIVTVSPARTGADRYLEIGFLSGPATLAAGGTSGDLNVAIFPNSGSFNEANDYSYDATGTKVFPAFADWTHITLYRNSTLVWGTEP